LNRVHDVGSKGECITCEGRLEAGVTAGKMPALRLGGRRRYDGRMPGLCCDIILDRMLQRLKKTLTISLLSLLASSLAVSFGAGCKRNVSARPKAQPIFRDANSFYILDPGPFKIIGPESPTDQEFLILRSGTVEISCGRYVGAFLSSGDPVADLEVFARQTVEDPFWLPGCHRWLLDTSEMTIGGRWYFTTTLLVRRDPALSLHLSNLQRLTHSRELGRFPDNEDRIVRLYYAFRDRNIYILTLDGPPEDVAASESDVQNLLAGIRLSAAEALTATGSGATSTAE